MYEYNGPSYNKSHSPADGLWPFTGLSPLVHAANIHDTKSGIHPAKKTLEKYPTIKRLCSDAGYRKSFEEDVLKTLGLDVDISERIKPREWKKPPWRWIVERTVAWFGHSQHLSKDFELCVASPETMVQISHLHTLLRRW